MFSFFQIFHVRRNIKKFSPSFEGGWMLFDWFVDNFEEIKNS